ncbi:MAG: deoxyribose-phosphate aldolase [Chloroflexi bacterium]|nr:deoxyribose-phosphate aldolase [Chloroflexota bacterium]
MNKVELARYIDHTLLKADAQAEQIRVLCDEARDFGFATVCINPVYVPLAASRLSGSEVAVCTVIGFPLGANRSAIKLAEAEQALFEGANELDLVIHIGALKSGEHSQVETEIASLARVCHAANSTLKVIIETALLTQEEKVVACQIAKAAEADFVKTSTGFSTGGATVQDVRLMRQTVGPGMGVKAAGGIRTYADAIAMIAAGASRIGASASVQIVAEAPS